MVVFDKSKSRKYNFILKFRNLKDNLIYLYKLNAIDRRTATFNLISKEEKIIHNDCNLHLLNR